FTTIVEPIPVSGQSIRLRWRQVSSSGADFDNWAIDEVEIPAFINTNVTITPDSGVIQAGANQLIDLNFDLTGILSGSYQFQLLLSSNDPTNPLLGIPVDLNINGDPILTFSDTCVVFDTVTQFTSASNPFTIYNTGCSPLNLTNITSTDIVFSVANFTPVSISPGDSAVYLVDFAPTAEQTYAASLIVSSNLGTDSLCVTGIGGGAPTVQLSPDSLSATIASCDSSVLLTLTVRNTGSGGLDFSSLSQGSGSGSVEVLALTMGTDLFGEFDNTKDAINQYFTNYNLTELNTSSPSTLQQALQGKDLILVPEQESNVSAIYSGLATVLQNFVFQGGSIIFCGGNANHVQSIVNSGILNLSYQTSSFSNGSPLNIVGVGHPILSQISSITIQ
ncbi:MAG: hypothetical protein AAFV78_18090, partial [Bacteroidota bacterium]